MSAFRQGSHVAPLVSPRDGSSQYKKPPPSMDRELENQGWRWVSIGPARLPARRPLLLVVVLRFCLLTCLVLGAHARVYGRHLIFAGEASHAARLSIFFVAAANGSRPGRG